MFLTIEQQIEILENIEWNASNRINTDKWSVDYGTFNYGTFNYGLCGLIHNAIYKVTNEEASSKSIDLFKYANAIQFRALSILCDPSESDITEYYWWRLDKQGDFYRKQFVDWMLAELRKQLSHE